MRGWGTAGVGWSGVEECLKGAGPISGEFKRGDGGNKRERAGEGKKREPMLGDVEFALQSCY